VTTTVHDVLRVIREKSTTNRELGTAFERLMVRFLSTDPLWSEQFSRVWMYGEWPGAAGDQRDLGIDLVAQERETGALWAIQCKFHEPDHTVQKPDIDSFFTASGKGGFAHRLIISTTDKWGPNAEAALDDQQIPVQRLGLSDIAASPVEWRLPAGGDADRVELSLTGKKSPRPHQREAVDAVFHGFEEHERGKLIMACGTGKTFTGLKIVERLAAERAASGQGEHTTVLFLVPSIALLSQTLREWRYETRTPLRAFAVCSDVKVSRGRVDADDLDMATHDLAMPATTDPARLLTQMSGDGGPVPAGLTVIFSTYQSIGTIAKAQEMGLDAFDLILCDEAHRTTGVTLSGHDESNFVRVHDNDVIRAARRLYMTATPRIYNEDTKADARDASAVLASMDDESLYGPEFHRLGFGKAVAQGLLTDYRVLILTVDQDVVAKSYQQGLAAGGSELNLDDAAKIIGCWNGLAKRTGTFGDGTHFEPGEEPMRRAVAFARSIKDSQAVADHFNAIVASYQDADDELLDCTVQHIDGTFNTLRRNDLLDWLKQDPGPNNARILSNARCLSEGVDVPNLDAVLFLQPRNSVVDVVQSVGRVMRLAPGKRYGYIILPVAVPAGMSPEEALADNRRFKTVWQVLQALRAHDDRFNASVNQIELNKKAPNTIGIGTIGAGDESVGDQDGSSSEASEQAKKDKEQQSARYIQDRLEFDEAWRTAIYARIVDKVGERTYWEQWAKDIALIAERHVARIRAGLADPQKAAAFSEFVEELRSNINPGVTDSNAIDMLAQHLITKPVFDALFQDYAFADHNPVSQAMQRMLDVLDDDTISAEAKTLQGFYESVRVRAEGITDHEGRQRVITELYEKFFKTALPKTADALGIVYTPTEVVDFILRSADQALERHFGRSLSDEDVHVLDPFTGTGTFVVRLLQSGLIKPADLLRKYTRELHANEIVLLAYYIAAVNIEAAFHDLYPEAAGGAGAGGAETYVPFDGIVLTDTFQLAETDEGRLFGEVLSGNSERARKQMGQDIRVVLGNPPYSVGQDSQNDDNQNLKYEALDGRIQETYAARSTAKNKNSLYDSYLRAFRWASDRIKDEGVVAFVSNGGYIDGNTANGVRKCLMDEFDTVYCYNLRGNARTAGDQRQKEAGNVFGSGSRNTVAVIVLVRGGRTDAPRGLFYRDIGDYLSREDKLGIVSGQSLDSVEWRQITPNADGDWINQRDERFGRFQPIGEKEKSAREGGVFALYSSGLKSGRDSWVYNFSEQKLRENVGSMVGFYNGQMEGFARDAAGRGVVSPTTADVTAFVDRDAEKISWNEADYDRIRKGIRYNVDPGALRPSVYRPFSRQWTYFAQQLHQRTYQLVQLFPTPEHENFGFYSNGVHATAEPAMLMVDQVPNLDVFGKGGYFFPRYTYRELTVEGGFDFGGEDMAAVYERVDNITDATLASYRKTYVDTVPGLTKDDIFFYVYGLLHSPAYREAYAADLKKSLPRIPKVRDFRAFAEAGRQLSELHIDYESAKPFGGIVMSLSNTRPDMPDSELFRVTKMKIPKTKGVQDRTRIVYNHHVTLENIPEQAYEYRLGARSAIEWIIDRYQVKTDPKSGIVNDPNDWSDHPRYVVDLLRRIVTVSLATVEIVKHLPPLDIVEDAT
jgi:predicted helicase